MKKENRRRLIDIALIITLGFIVYVNSLDGKFILDDTHLIENNVRLRDWSRISDIFTESVGSGSGRQYSFYRPFQMLTYMADYSFWNLNTKGYHLTNILLHILAALCVYWFVTILSKNNTVSLFTGLLFVAHPVHTEAVSYLSGRADPLALIFILLSFILYVKNIASARAVTHLLILLTYILAILSKENSLIFPILLLLYHYTFNEKIRLRDFLPILIISFIYIAIRFTVLREILNSTTIIPPVIERIPGSFVALFSYIKILLLPLDLHMEYGAKLFLYSDTNAVIGMIILFLLIISAVVKRNTNKLLFFSILWFLIALIPVSNLYPINAYMAEHWLYMPSVGIFLLIANTVSSALHYKKLKIFAFLTMTAFISFYSLLTIKQNSYWKNPVTFYERTLKYNPDSATMHNNLGVIYYTNGEKQKAVAFFRKAIEVEPQYAGAYINLANASLYLGNKEESILLLKKAIEINPMLMESYMNLGSVYNSMNKTEDAITIFKQAVMVSPNYAPAHNNLAVLYYFSKKYDLAIMHCDKAVALGYNVPPELLEAIKQYRTGLNENQ